MKRYDHKELERVMVQILQAVDVPEEDAKIVAESLIEAELQGASTHGVSRLGIYVERIRKGLINPKARLIIRRESASTMVIDADNGLGQVQAYRAMGLLIPKAKCTGCATATIRNSQHFGSLSYYCNKALEKGVLLMAMTNCEPSMAPTGGCSPIFGTNPIAISFPTSKGYPLKIDLATSVVARGNIIQANRKGINIPEGWALDRDGNPTTDAKEALEGVVLTMAGHKGYALALMVELLSGALSGASMGNQIGSMYKNLDRKQDVGHIFIMLNIESFIDHDVFTERIDSLIDEIKNSKRQRDVKEILIPGERSIRKRIENMSSGIGIGKETIEEIESLCISLGIEFSLKPLR